MARHTGDPDTGPRRRDDSVGASGEPPAGGGHQTAEQAAVTDMGPSGAAKPEPKANWGAAGEAGRPPVAVGGSSGGHSDRIVSRGAAAGEKVADGPTKAEQEDGR